MTKEINKKWKKSAKRGCDLHLDIGSVLLDIYLCVRDVEAFGEVSG